MNIDNEKFAMYTWIMETIEKTNKIVQKVFEEAKQGKVEIECAELGNWTYHVKFLPKIADAKVQKGDNDIVVIVPSYENFVGLVDKYLESATKFYSADKDYFMLTNDGYKEKLFMDLMVNATNYDLHNIESYIEKRTKMLSSNVKTGNYEAGEFAGLKVSFDVSKNHSNLEGTHKFSVKFSDNEGNEFVLPEITFSTLGDVCFVYAVQSKKQKEDTPKNAVQKKLDRYFRKVNKDVPEELQNVSPNALVVFTYFAEQLKKQNTKAMIAPNFMPIRYESKIASFSALNKTEEEKQEFLAKHNHDQFNITNKFMDLLVRYNFHFSGTEISYDDNTQTMLLEFGEKGKRESGDNIIFDIASLGDSKSQAERTMN